MKPVPSPPIPFDDFLSLYNQQSTESLHLFFDKKVIKITEPSTKPTYCQILSANPYLNSSKMSIQGFQQRCLTLHVDSYYCNSIIQTFSDLSSSQRGILFASQLAALENDTSYHSRIEKIISARANCIKHIKLSVDNLKQSIARISELDELCVLLIHLRILTLLVIESIVSWNSSLDSLFENRSREVKYEHAGVDVLSEISMDTEFLKTTILRKYLKFAKGFDPLLIRLSKKGRENRKENEMLIVNYDQEDIERFTQLIQLEAKEVGRLRNAEMVLIKHHSWKQEVEEERKHGKRGYESKEHSFSDLRSVSIPLGRQEPRRNWEESEDNGTIEVESGSITLPKISGVEETPKRFPGFISNRSNSRSSVEFSPKQKEISSDLSLPKTNGRGPGPAVPIKQQTPQRTEPRERRNHLMKRIRVLSQQLKSDMQLETQKYLRIVNRSSNCSESRAKVMTKSLNSLMKILPATIDQTPQRSFRKRRVGAKAQKFRILKDIYCDKIQSDLQVSLRIIRDRAQFNEEPRKSVKRRHFEASDTDSSQCLPEMLKLRQRIKSSPVKISVSKRKRNE